MRSAAAPVRFCTISNTHMKQGLSGRRLYTTSHHDEELLCRGEPMLRVAMRMSEARSVVCKVVPHEVDDVNDRLREEEDGSTMCMISTYLRLPLHFTCTRTEVASELVLRLSDSQSQTACNVLLHMIMMTRLGFSMYMSATLAPSRQDQEGNAVQAHNRLEQQTRTPSRHRRTNLPLLSTSTPHVETVMEPSTAVAG